MAQISITIPDEHLPRVVDAFAALGAWTSDMGVTKAAFAKQMLIEHIKNTVLESEARTAQMEAAAARAIVQTEIRNMALS
jgi:putative heme iron utilization protein